MLDFFNTNGSGQQTSIMLILFALSLTFLLSLILVLVYERTSRQVARQDHFIQSLLLMSIVTATIMQSIGDSLALSFGIFGALAIIRFRTSISDPRDVAFVFASMAIGISCGVHSFLNGILGTIAFCIVIILLRFSPFGQKSNLIGELRFELPISGAEHTITNVLENFDIKYMLKKVKLNVVEEQKYIEYEYKFKLDNINQLSELTESLSNINEGKLIKINFNDVNDVEIV
jgi:uncharacterized membrane protein YhiD involved in acid resistance